MRDHKRLRFTNSAKTKAPAGIVTRHDSCKHMRSAYPTFGDQIMKNLTPKYNLDIEVK